MLERTFFLVPPLRKLAHLGRHLVEKKNGVQLENVEVPEEKQPQPVLFPRSVLPNAKGVPRSMLPNTKGVRKLKFANSFLGPPSVLLTCFPWAGVAAVLTQTQERSSPVVLGTVSEASPEEMLTLASLSKAEHRGYYSWLCLLFRGNGKSTLWFLLYFSGSHCTAG